MTTENRERGTHAQNLAVNEAQQSTYPVLRRERTWGPIAFIAIASSLSAGTWLFPVGGAVAAYTPAWPGTLLMTGGMMIGTGLLLIGTVPIQAKFGVDSVTSTAPYLGVVGAKLSIVLVWLPIAAWNAILTIIMGRSVVRILARLGVVSLADADISKWGNIAGSLMLFGILLFTIGGADVLKRLEIVLAIIALIIVLIIFGMLFVKFGPSQIGAAKPLSPLPDHQQNYTTVVELMMGSAMSWWPWVGGLVRLVPSPRASLPGVLLGLGLTVPVVSAASLWSSLVANDPDPSVWMITVGGTSWGLVALILVVKANIGTIAINLFVSGVAANRIPSIQKRVRWSWNLIIMCAPVTVVVLFFGDTFMEQTPKIMAFSGLFYAPLCGIAAIDYFVLRRKNVSIRGFYDESRDAPYYYWRGINPVAFLSAMIGVGVYLLLLDPLTLEAHGPFKWISATIPTFIAASLAYYVGTKLVTIPAGRGDYERS